MQTGCKRFLQLTPEWLTIRPLAAVTLGITPTQGRANARIAITIGGPQPGYYLLNNRGSRSRGDHVRRTPFPRF